MDLTGILAHPYFPIYVITFVFMLIGMAVQGVLKSRMEKYSRILNSAGMNGRQIAERMLYDHGITDVEVTSVDGFLTDHYNPKAKTVNLSPQVFQTASVASAAIAAHEVGHAVQHAVGYKALKLRSALVPLVKVSSSFLVQILIVAGIFMVNIFPQLLLAGIVLFAATTLFTLITLPVEFDATRRGLAWIKDNQIATGEEFRMAKDGLRWAAMTYVVAALQSVATLLYYLLIFLGARDN